MRGADILSANLDSNAVRHLGTLSESAWSKLINDWQAQEHATAWIPRVVTEVLGTNLDRKGGLQEADLAEVVLAVQRFDKLAGGAILPDEHEVLVRAFYELAGIEPPPLAAEPATGSSPSWRDMIDLGKALDSTDLVGIEIDNGQHSVVLKNRDNPEIGIKITPDSTFVGEASRNVRFWRRRTKCKRGAAFSDRVKEVVEFLPEYLALAATSMPISIPTEVVLAIRDTERDRIFDSVLGHRFVIESWYLHFRATGDKQRINNNDMADIAIASYIPCGRFFVTDDSELQRVLNEVLGNPGRVLSCQDFCRTAGSLEATE